MPETYNIQYAKFDSYDLNIFIYLFYVLIMAQIFIMNSFFFPISK